ncbi:zinc finger protein 622-like [Centruroides sculpturatus]|uniref:zinc finger protein 622-like n=1 Tax=Centruroides sculpturatus TaxID=218467 RepID=UPI000C6E66C8|nr:zinc finger protein 622-like [Centruroides sculpturatus]
MSFTCITCRVVFNHPEVQRGHYKSEWHRYNLKRKVAELPPVTEEKFQEKESQHKTVEIKQNLATYCGVCRKNFASINALEAHQKSKKHQLAAKTPDKEEFKKAKREIRFRSDVTNMTSDVTSCEEEEVIEEGDDDDDDDEWESCDETEESTGDVCPFCDRRHGDVGGNLRHMTLRHSFFVPDPEYVVDLPGLISHLNRKVTEDRACPWCNRCFGSAIAVRRHVADSGHAKIGRGSDGLLEYADFYDYSSGYPRDDPEAGPALLDDGGWELVLPSGTTVGHRSLARYYRQNLRPHDRQREEKSKRLMRATASRYRALGWTSSADGRAVSGIRTAGYATRVRSRWTLKLGLQNNKLQHHFRPQVTF